MAGSPQMSLVIFQFRGTRIAVEAQSVDRIGYVPSPVPEELEMREMHTLLGAPDYRSREPRVLYMKQPGKALKIDQLEDIWTAAAGSLHPLPRLITRLAAADYLGWTAGKKHEVVLILDISGMFTDA